MKNQIKNNYKALSSKELTVINGGCGGEDYICPEQEELQEILEALKRLIIVI